jgi:hypothetical protein
VINLNWLEVPEGTVAFATVTVRNRTTDEVEPANVVLLPEVELDFEQDGSNWGYNEEALSQMSDELRMLMTTCIAVSPDVFTIARAVHHRGYQLVFENDEDCLATDLVPDDLSSLG